MDSKRRGDPPHLEDISGSKNWDNMVDQGFVVHRPKMADENGNRCTDAVLIQRKSRFEELGYPCVLKMDYRLNEGRYVSADYPQEYGVNRA
jgi:twinkle protein